MTFKGHLVFPTPLAAWPDMISDPDMAEGQLLLHGHPKLLNIKTHCHISMSQVPPLH